jgi:hypothetical protein
MDAIGRDLGIRVLESRAVAGPTLINAATRAIGLFVRGNILQSLVHFIKHIFAQIFDCSSNILDSEKFDDIELS